MTKRQEAAANAKTYTLVLLDQKTGEIIKTARKLSLNEAGSIRRFRPAVLAK